MEELSHPTSILALLRLQGVGTKSVASIVSASRTRSAALRKLADATRTRDLTIRSLLEDNDQWQASAERSRANVDGWSKRGIQVVSVFCEDYPSQLRCIPDPPLLLWVLGELQPVRAVALVGTREPSPRSVEVARRLSETAVEVGFGIVSGLALGIDSTAHETCLAAGGYTVAVLGCGVDVPYPEKNRSLYERILASGGAVVSEVEPGARVTRPSLVLRDRIQSGLSDAVVVVESTPTGGSMHTARYAVDQGRRLASIVRPGDRESGTALLAGDPDKAIREIPAMKKLARRGAPLAHQLRDREDYLRLLREQSIPASDTRRKPVQVDLL